MNRACLTCHQLNPDDAIFCGECGAPLNKEFPCATCGRTNPFGLKFCCGCGARLSEHTALPPLLSPPTVLAAGRYQIRRLLGEGSKKRVYLAHDTHLERDVALALFKINGLNHDNLMHIWREAHALARLGDHPHIVTLYDVGEERGNPYFVSQYMAGGTLQEFLQRRAQYRLSLDQALRLAEQLCQALSFAHKTGILHRDLKPTNVWLTPTGDAKLGDFGIATSMEYSRFTLEGVLLGTAAYMPPEQLLGRKAEIRSDLYSLGALLYEMVAGRPPFIGDSLVSLIAQHLNTLPLAPSCHNSAIPPALDTLLLQLLAKTPEERPESADAVSATLRTLASSLHSQATPFSSEKLRTLDRLTNDVFVGREREIDVLRNSLEEVLTGQGRAVVLLGEPGMGKTRTAVELTTYARLRGLQVLAGRCHEEEGAPPYWPLVQIIRAYLAEHDLATLQANMGPGIAAIAEVLPEVRDYMPGLPTPSSLESEHARFRFFDSYTQFLKNITRQQPTVLFLDDVQWADIPSLLFLQFLAHTLGETPLLLLATCREGESPQQSVLTQTLAVLARTPGSQLLHLQGLTDRAVSRFIELSTGQSPTKDVAAAVYQHTEGHPFFMTEVVRLLVTEKQPSEVMSQQSILSHLPYTVRSVIERRLAQVSDACRRVLSIASVSGREFSLNVLEEVWTSSSSWREEQGKTAVDPATIGLSPQGERESVLLALLDEAATTRLITPLPRTLGRYSFSHALIRETLYKALPLSQRVYWHRVIGEALERVAGVHLAPIATELAHHFSQAGEHGGAKALHYLRWAGQQATEALAYEDAVTHYERAFQLLALKKSDEAVQCELLLALGEAQHRAGNSPQARETFLQAARLARTLKATEPFAQAVLGFGGELLIPGEMDQTLIDLLEETLKTLPEADSRLRARAMGRLAMELFQTPAPERRLALSSQAVDMARRLGDVSTLASALSTRRYAIWGPDHLEERLAVANELVHLGEKVHSKETALLGHHWRVTDLLEAGDLPTVDVAIDAHARLATELHQRFHSWYSAIFRTMRALLNGEFERGEELAQEALAVGQQARLPVATMMFGLQMFLLRREQGRLEEMEPALRQFAEQAPAFAIARYMLAYCYAELEREVEARRIFTPLTMRHFADLSRDSNWLIGLSYSAEVCNFVEDRSSAAIVYDLLLPYAERMLVVGRATICYGSVCRILGLLAATLERWEEAEAHFEAALRRHVHMAANPLIVRTQYNYGSMLLKRGHPGDREKASTLLDQALTMAQELGMAGLVEKVQRATCNVQRTTNPELRDQDLDFESQGVQPLRAQTRDAKHPIPHVSSPTPHSSMFRCEGDYWTLSYQGNVIRLKDVTGLRYLAHLLRHPDIEIHALDLVSIGAVSFNTAPARQNLDVVAAGGRIADLGDAGEQLDAQARAAYKQRLVDLQDALKEAEKSKDLDRIEALREEIAFLTQELASAIGLGGRSRKVASAAERARVNVTRSIKTVLKKIAQQNPALELYLSATIKTGAFCSYTPDPRLPISWEF